MKSFKKYIAEVAEPNNPEEKKFKDQHKVVADKHPVALDHQHTGDIKKPKAKRKADQEGDANYDLAYESVEESVEEMEEVDLEETTLSATKKPVNVTGPDGKVRTVMRRSKAVQHDEKGQDVIKTRSEELSPKQKKIDHNKNGKIDGHDLAMLRSKKKNEEVELSKELAELKKSTYGSYIKKATQDVVDAQREITSGGTKHKDYPEYRDLRNKRKKGIAKAVDRLTKEGVELEEAKNIEPAKPDPKAAARRKAIEKAQSGKKKDDWFDDEEKPKVRKMGGRYGYGSYDEESVEEAFGNWQVKTNKITKTYKARHAGEALRKAKESGHFGNIALDAKHVSKVNESVEQLDEMTFKKGPLELNDGKQVMLSSEDAKVLNDMFKKLDPRNKRTMEKSIVKNQSNFSELLKFAKEVD